MSNESYTDMRSRWIATEASRIASEREWLKKGAASSVRTLRLIAQRTIRRSQRELARIANEIIADREARQ